MYEEINKGHHRLEEWGIMKIFFTVIGSVIALICIGFILLVVIALGMDFYKSISSGNGWISQDRNGRAIKELIKEENGCAYYIDVWENQGKTCGAYDLRMYK